MSIVEKPIDFIVLFLKKQIRRTRNRLNIEKKQNSPTNRNFEYFCIFFYIYKNEPTFESSYQLDFLKL